jgi:hypothetical protein
MTNDDIIRMAREAGLSKPWDQEPVEWKTLERFANLVAAAERESCAKLCELIEDDEFYWGRQYAEAIRARGQE